MTMMAGAVVAPSLPQMSQHFANVPNAEILTRLIITLPALFIAIFSPINGWLIDKYGRKNILLFSYILYAVGGLSGFFLQDLHLILVGRAFLGIAVAGVMTCTVALIGDYYQGAERNGFMGYQGAFMSFGGVTFISVAGILADIDWQYPFLIYLFSLLVFIYYVPSKFKKSKVDSLVIFNFVYFSYNTLPISHCLGHFFSDNNNIFHILS